MAYITRPLKSSGNIARVAERRADAPQSAGNRAGPEKWAIVAFRLHDEVSGHGCADRLSYSRPDQRRSAPLSVCII